MFGNRRGISLTPFLIVFIILFLGATALAYMFSSQLNNEKKNVERAVADKEEVEDRFRVKVTELDKLAEVTGYFGTPGAETETSLVKDPGVIKLDLTEVNTELDPPLTPAEVTCKRVIRELRLQRQSLVTQLREAKLNLENKESQLEEEKNTKRRIQQQQTEEIGRVREEARKSQQRLEQNIQQYERQVTDLRTSREKLANANDQVAAESRTQAQKDMLSIKDLQARVLALSKKEQIEATPMPDGRIVRADLDQGYAYIDLGSKDGVRAGQRFKVYAVLKGGLRQEKGEVRIIRVEKDFSQCSILAMSDTTNPIVSGDSIWNKFFVKGRKLTFSFVGKFGGENVQSTKEQLMRIVREAGHVVSDKVHSGTDYVVLGDEFANEEEYRKAQDYHTEKIRPAELYAFFGYGEFSK